MIIFTTIYKLQIVCHLYIYILYIYISYLINACITTIERNISSIINQIKIHNLY